VAQAGKYKRFSHLTVGWMDGWKNGLANGRRSRLIDRWTDKQMDWQTNRRMDWPVGARVSWIHGIWRGTPIQLQRNSLFQGNVFINSRPTSHNNFLALSQGGCQHNMRIFLPADDDSVGENGEESALCYGSYSCIMNTGSHIDFGHSCALSPSLSKTRCSLVLSEHHKNQKTE
jgi:hypothetical protein